MQEEKSGQVERILNRLDDALVRLTVLEERLAQNSRTFERIFSTVEEHAKKIQQLQTANAISETKIGFNERIVWMIITVAVGIIGYSVKQI